MPPKATAHMGGLHRPDSGKEPPCIARVLAAGEFAQEHGVNEGDRVVVGRYLRPMLPVDDGGETQLVVTRWWCVVCVVDVAHVEFDPRTHVWRIGRDVPPGMRVDFALFRALKGQAILKWRETQPSGAVSKLNGQAIVMADAHNPGTFNRDLTNEEDVRKSDLGIVGGNVAWLLSANADDLERLGVKQGDTVLYEKESAVEAMTMVGKQREVEQWMPGRGRFKMLETDGSAGPRCAYWMAELAGQRGSWVHVVDIDKICAVHETGEVAPGEFR